MTDDTNRSQGDESSSAVPTEIADAVKAPGWKDQKPAWLDKFVWRSLWKVAAVALTVFVLIVAAHRAQHLIKLLVISVFFALAMVPAVNYFHDKRGWKRGAAVGVIYAGLIAFMVIMIAFLLPGIANFAERVTAEGPEWVTNINDFTEDSFGFPLVDDGSGDDATAGAGSFLENWGDEILGLASSGIGLIFDLATIAMFTFYFAADYQRISRAFMSRMPPRKQKVYGWVSDTALEQTGGYFYSRALIMVINGVLFFGAMVLVGMPVGYAVALSVFEAFVATFIPAVGTYIGAAVPILLTLVVQGLVAAVILLVWTLIYQQVENYWLSPKLSADTMELNGGVAFGAALAGGAIAGPMGAFMSLPVAAMITATISNLGKTYDVVYESKYDSADEVGEPTADDA